MKMLKLKLIAWWILTLLKSFIFVSVFFSELPVLKFYTHWGYEEGGNEAEKLMQLSVLIGVRIAKVFHFLRKYVGVKRIMYSNVTFIVKLKILFLLGF